MISRPVVLISAALCATSLGCRDVGPDSAAKQYEQRRITGDLAQIPPLLLPTEAQALSAHAASLSDAGLSEMGLPSATVDSARVARDAGDSATVHVFVTGPNTRALMGELFTRAMSGQLDTSASGVRKALATAPRITLIDTVTLVKVGREWKVSLRLNDRHAAKLALKGLHDAYVNDDLSAAATAARALLAAHAKAPTVVDSEDVAKAHDAITAQGLVDSIAADLVVEKGFLGSSLRGYVRNLSGATLVDVVLKVRDAAGQTQKVTVHRLEPKAQKSVFEMLSPLTTGRPAKVEIAWVNLGAWESISF